MSDLINRQAAINATYFETADTNPEHFKSNEKFIEFMDDADIASFGWWQWANGFSTALLATRIQLEKLSSAPQWIPCSERLPKEGGDYLVTISFDIGGKEPVKEVKRDYFCVLSKKWLYSNDEVVAWMEMLEPYGGR